MSKRIFINHLLGLLLVLLPHNLTVAQQQWHLPSGAPLYAYLADTLRGEPHPAVIVCPGGSYSWHDMESEGAMVAQWLNTKGIHAFVLKYRVQGILAFWSHYRYLLRGHRHPDAVVDVQEALALVRGHAAEWSIDQERVGVMGFSAGGHLAVLSAELAVTPTERPDFVASIYPVVTFVQEPYVHRRSRRALLGEWHKRDMQLCDSLSLERHVTAAMPPVFLVNCIDDPTVHYHNSELLDSALTAEDVDHLYLQYQTGGHGFGANPQKGTVECQGWRERFIEWLKVH